jgi:hypothetical protein
MFSKELEVINKLNHLETELLIAFIKVLLASSIVASVLEFNFSLEYLLKYLKKFPLNLSYFQLMSHKNSAVPELSKNS